jgi:hypothetical protein
MNIKEFGHSHQAKARLTGLPAPCALIRAGSSQGERQFEMFLSRWKRFGAHQTK